ncbi:hypothetical protein IWZ01DRAFT_550465 [Phyllosticta capitalensis]
MAGIRTYDEIPEHTFSPGDSNQQADGRSIYRGLARQLLGDPGNFNDIVGEVLHHFLRVFFNSQHPLHGQYRSFDGKNFYYSLSRPDFSDSGEVLVNVLDVVSNALRVQIYLGDVDGREQFIASSVIPEHSGEDLINYMSAEKRKNRLLNIKQIKWWWNPESESTQFECANEFVSRANFNLVFPTPALRNTLRYGYPAIFLNFVVSIKTTTEIKPAVDLLLRILPLSPGQGIPVNVDLSKAKADFRKTSAASGQLLPYVGIDAEFKLVSDDQTISETDLQNMTNDDGPEAENLCTVLTIAVDRHVTFHFYILHILEQGSNDTVSEEESKTQLSCVTKPLLAYLWEKVIFNEDLLKLWFNFQSDITVLDNTIAHLQLGLHEKEEETMRVWTKERRGFGYVKLLQQFLKNDWMFPILNHLKDAPNRWVERNTQPEDNDEDGEYGGGSGGKPNKAGFFRSFGPSMESDSDKLGYNIGDVVGIALIFRFLTTTENRQLLFARLRNISDNEQTHGQDIRPQQSPFNMSTKNAQDIGIPLITDNLRSWTVDASGMWNDTEKAPWTEQSTYLANCNYSYAAHENLIKTFLTIKRDEPLLSLQEIREKTKSRLYDPCRFALPPIMASVPEIPDEFKPPVIQGMEMHCEDLYRRICAASSSGSDFVVPHDLRASGTNREIEEVKKSLNDEMSNAVRAAQNHQPYRWTEASMTITEYLPTAIERAVSTAKAKEEEAATEAKNHGLSVEQALAPEVGAGDYAYMNKEWSWESKDEDVTAEAAAKAEEHPLSTMEAEDQEPAAEAGDHASFNTNKEYSGGMPFTTQSIEQKIPEVEMQDAESFHSDPGQRESHGSNTQDGDGEPLTALLEVPETEDEGNETSEVDPLKVIEHLVELKKVLNDLKWYYIIKPDDVFGDDWGQKYAERLSKAPPFEQDAAFSASNATRTAEIQEWFDKVNQRIEDFKNDLKDWDDEGRKQANQALKDPPIIDRSSSRNGPSPNAGPSQIHRSEKKRPRESSTVPPRRSKRVRKEPDRFANSSQ